jgi:hypothetical protein
MGDIQDGLSLFTCGNGAFAMTIGEDRVRIKFNPSDNSLVSTIKQKVAELIDLCEEQKKRDYQVNQTNSESNRLWSLAQTHFEDAAMWAVKAATFEK